MFRRVLAGLVVVAALVAGLFFAQRHPALAKVSGIIEADEIRIGSRVGGRVASVSTEEGDRIRQGEVLVTLEPFDLLHREQEAKAILASRQADVDRFTQGFRDEEIRQAKARYEQFAAQAEQLKNGPRTEEIEAARGRRDAASAEFVLAEREMGRAARLADSNAISSQELELAEQKLKSARAMVIVRTNELQILEIGARSEELAEAQARLVESQAAWDLVTNGYRGEEVAKAVAARDAARATLEAVRDHLGELEIRSPCDGIVEAIELQAGDLVSPGAPVLSVVNDGELWVRAYVPERHLHVQVGQKVELTIDSFPGERFVGEISFIARQAEFTPSNVQTPEERAKQVFRVKVHISDPRLRPGMSADVWLDSLTGERRP